MFCTVESGCVLESSELRGSGKYGVWQGIECDAFLMEHGRIELWYFGIERPAPAFELVPYDTTHAPLNAYKHAAEFSELESLESVSTRAWWRGGYFIVSRVIGSEVAVEFTHKSVPGKDYRWFVEQPEIDASEYDRILGVVPVSELYDVEQTVTSLPLEPLE